MAKATKDKTAAKAEEKGAPESASKEEQVGFHKGSLATLAKERQELARILQIVEQLMQMHIGALKDLGVDLQKEAQEASQPVPNKKKPIEDII